MEPKFYQVGGSVRDELLGLRSKDVDYAVEADSYDALLTAIKARGGEIFLETPQYLTVRAKVPQMGACDFVLCRKDGTYYDGRHPESVTPGTIYDDLARRDFTVNAIAKAEDGTYLDPHNGRGDLDKGRLVCVGDTITRFTEDGLRMFRALRFSITRDLWKVEPIQMCLMDGKFVRERLEGVSVERIREELEKCFRHNTVATMVELQVYKPLRDMAFAKTGRLWLRPTLEAR